MSNSAPSLQIIMSLFGAMLMILARERKSLDKGLSQTETRKFTSFHELIEQYYFSNREANYYATKLGMTYKTLNQLCKKVTGKTAKTYIDQYVITEAKRRLIINKCDITTIAYDLGFNEMTNFTKFFKRYVSLTPGQYRDNIDTDL